VFSLTNSSSDNGGDSCQTTKTTPVNTKRNSPRVSWGGGGHARVRKMQSQIQCVTQYPVLFSIRQRSYVPRRRFCVP